MPKVTLVKRISNAKNRDLDTMYYKKTKLVLPPHNGHKILTHGKVWEIVNVFENVDLGLVFVEIEADHTTFKGGDFDKRCKQMESFGWKEMTPDQIKNFRKEEL